MPPSYPLTRVDKLKSGEERLRRQVRNHGCLKSTSQARSVAIFHPESGGKSENDPVFMALICKGVAWVLFFALITMFAIHITQ